MKTLLAIQKRVMLLAILVSCIFIAKGQTPVEKHGQLKIFNGKVSDQNNNPVILRGMSLFWSGYPEGSPFYNATTIKWLRDDWCVDVIRVAMSVETGNTNYINNPSTELAKVKTVIDACIANGLYVIVDYHTHNAPSYKNQAKTFFTEIANTYGNTPNVLYEPYNEPISQSWSGTIKPYHNELISTIRAIDPDNIIICGTRTYSQDVDEAANDPVTGTNIAYTLHYYANSHQASLRQKATNALNKGVALFVTEYGTCDASGNGGFNSGESQNWWNYLESNKIGSCNWSVCNKNETASILTSGTSALSNWTSGQLTASGTLVRNYIKDKCNVVVTTGSITVSFPGNQTQYNAGETVTMNATTTVANGTINNVKFYSGATLLHTDNSSPYSFSTAGLASGGHNITAKSFDGSGNVIATSPVYVISIVGASNVSTTGITDQFEETTQFSELTGGVTGASCASANAAAAAGIYWFEDRNAATPFKAEATRSGDGKLSYLISQPANSYNVVGFNFGEYCEGGVKKKYTLDLSGNAVLNMTVATPNTNTATLDLKFQMKDLDGTVIAINKTVLVGGVVDGANWYKHEIGYSKNHVAPDYLSLAPNTTSNFTFDFKNALSVDNPNNPSYPADINTNNSDFDFTKVVEVVIIPVNRLDNGAPNYQPLAFTDQRIIFSGLTLGNPALGTDICTTSPAPSASNATYCQNATNASALTATAIPGLNLKWYTDPTGGVGNDLAPIPSTSVAGVTTYYVSQGISSTCEGPRTAVNVTIQEAPTADAGSSQVLCNASSATLSANAATAPATGSWSVISGPATVNTPASPTSNIAISGAGDIVLQWTISTASCGSSNDQVTITNAAPNTAEAGSNQQLCNASSTTLAANAASALATGSWSVISGPGTVTTPSSPTSNLSISGTGDIVLQWTVSGGPCTSNNDQVTITNAAQTIADAGSNQQLCNASSTTLAANAASALATGSWSVISGPGTVTSPSSPSSNVNLTGTGNVVLQWTVSGGPCTTTNDQVTISNVAQATADAGSNQTGVQGPSTSLSGTGSATGTWSLLSGPGGASVTFSPSANTASVTANGLTATGTYTFQYLVAGTSPCSDATSSVTVNVTGITSVSKASLDASLIEMYPNPASDKLYINMSKVNGSKSVKLIDMYGRVVFETTDENTVNIEMSNLNNGMYFVQIESESGNLVKPVIKQ